MKNVVTSVLAYLPMIAAELSEGTTLEAVLPKYMPDLGAALRLDAREQELRRRASFIASVAASMVRLATFIVEESLAQAEAKL